MVKTNILKKYPKIGYCGINWFYVQDTILMANQDVVAVVVI